MYVEPATHPRPRGNQPARRKQQKDPNAIEEPAAPAAAHRCDTIPRTVPAPDRRKRTDMMREAPRNKPDYAKTGFISSAGLRALGWSKPDIERLLGEPDKTAKNPYYAIATPTRLYDIVRAAQAETDIPTRLDGSSKVKSLWPAARIIAARNEKRTALLHLVADGEASVKTAASLLGCSPATFRKHMQNAGLSWPASKKAAQSRNNPSPETREIREKTAFETAYRQAAETERELRRKAEAEEMRQARQAAGLPSKSAVSKARHRAKKEAENQRRHAARLEDRGTRCQGATPDTPDGRCLNQKRDAGPYCRRCEKIFA